MWIKSEIKVKRRSASVDLGLQDKSVDEHLEQAGFCLIFLFERAIL